MSKYQFYESMPQNTDGMNLYRVVKRQKAGDPKVGALETCLYLAAESQEAAVYGIARDLGAGRYIPVLVRKK